MLTSNLPITEWYSPYPADSITGHIIVSLVQVILLKDDKLTYLLLKWSCLLNNTYTEGSVSLRVCYYQTGQSREEKYLG